MSAETSEHLYQTVTRNLAFLSLLELIISGSYTAYVFDFIEYNQLVYAKN